MANEKKKTNRRSWWKAAGIRALRTSAQAAIAQMTVYSVDNCTLLTDINWLCVLSTSVLAGVLSLLTSIAGLPEVKTDD